MIFWMYLLSILIILSKNPYFLMITLLIMTFNTIIIMTKMMISQLYSLLILLVFVGGLLIMFLYMVSLIPTESMKFNMNLLTMGLPLIIITNKYYYMSQSTPFDLNVFLLYNFVSIIFFFLLFLLCTLFSATFITNTKMGPLRKS